VRVRGVAGSDGEACFAELSDATAVVPRNSAVEVVLASMAGASGTMEHASNRLAISQAA
jgi:hypothetical protein